ncbi:sigma-Y antisigma factor component [Paenibacillus sp. SYP-B4298]|uniref:sigma-Y antisigma factor component n=1 Tax=Paenibacillus sp. SYP-B4298 TaxID=2996034 RepID=UPI0022DDDDC9|nr:sigma-Y antisigma factor component [Paenibacillus sp. SYP-B4298]
MGTELNGLVIVTVVTILLLQGSWMFRDAERRGHNKWLWGLLGLVQFPTYLLIYLYFVKRKGRKA